MVPWGQTTAIRIEDPATVFVTAQGLTNVTAAGNSLPLLVGSKEATASGALTAGRVVGSLRVAASSAGRRPAQLDVRTPSGDFALDEFMRALRLVDIALPRLRGGFVYLDSTGTPRKAVDPFRVASFVLDNVETITSHLHSIAENPQTDRATAYAVRPPGPAVDGPRTRAFLTRHPEFMHESTEGAVPVAGSYWAPSLAVMRRRTDTLDTTTHRRIARFVGRLWREAGLASPMLSDAAQRWAMPLLANAQEQLAHAIASTFFGELPGSESDDLVLQPTAVEESTAHYRELHALRHKFHTEVTPQGATSQLERQHLARPDEIYQALCTSLLAAAFGLSPSPGSAGGVWQSDDWELWVNRVGAISSWRTSTPKPDDYRPDLVLRRLPHGREVILLDAKFAVSRDGGVPGERLKEVQAYLNAYGLHQAGILFPGSMDRARTVDHFDVEAEGFRMREIPLRAIDPGDLDATLPRLRQRVLELQDAGSFGVSA